MTTIYYIIITLILVIIIYLTFSYSEIFSNIDVYPGYNYKILDYRYTVPKHLVFKSEMKSVKQHILNNLYIMMKDIGGILEDNDIQYFVVGGTLISATRHNTFMPWDDDIDIAYFIDDHDKIKSLKLKLDRKGYDLLECLPGFIIQNKKYRDVTMDLFMVDFNNDEKLYMYAAPVINKKSSFEVSKLWPRETFTKDMIFPLKRKLICNNTLEIIIPNKSIEILKSHYSPSVMDEVYSAPQSSIHKFRKAQWIMVYVEKIIPSKLLTYIGNSILH